MLILRIYMYITQKLTDVLLATCTCNLRKYTVDHERVKCELSNDNLGSCLEKSLKIYQHVENCRFMVHVSD